MRVRRAGRCIRCGAKTIQHKQLDEDIDMFDAEPKTRIRGTLLEQLKAWRDEPILCEAHSATAIQHNATREGSDVRIK